MNMKKIFFIFLGIFVFSFGVVSGATLTNTTLAVGENSSYVNGTISFSEMIINESIDIYSLSTGGIFTGINGTLIFNFYGLSSFEANDDLRWDNGTEIYFISSISLELNESRYFEIGNFYVFPAPSTSKGASGLSSEETSEELSEEMVGEYNLTIICKSIKDYFLNKSTFDEIKNQIEREGGINISSSNVTYYFENYNELCNVHKSSTPFSSITKKEKKNNIIFYILFILVVVITISIILGKRLKKKK